MQELYLLCVILYWTVIFITAFQVLMDNRQPSKTVAWIMVMVFVPFVGWIFYLFFGISHRRERLVSERSLNQLSKRQMLEFVEQHDLHVPPVYKPIIDLFINQNLALPFGNNNLQIFREGDEFFLRLIADLGAAKSSIHLDMYIFEDDALGSLIADVLIDKVRQGVEVRVIYDDVGCWHVHADFFERMREEGVEVVTFLPVRFPSFTSKVNYRNHRKLIIIDGKVGYIGGMNIALRYIRGTRTQPWRDTMLRLSGRSVYGLQRAFLVDWYFVDRTLISNHRYYPEMTEAPSPLLYHPLAQIVTSSPITPSPEIMQGYVRIIMGAQKYVYMETPYFLPNEPVLFALKTAAKGGIDVRVMVPMYCDARFVDWAGRSFLREVAESGVKVLLYKAGFLHSKILVSDDNLATCGSTNVDFRSFENNFEGNAFLYDHDTAIGFRQLFESDERQCIHLQQMDSRWHPRFFARLAESILRLLAPLL